ncbi:hypothetical protein CBM2615_B140209 [Cupriavidus taiwanensis]|uniref:Uncharacterized protein n=1 Tax=Cupriavidus taiwanensis TaxID=164546 RepID=A0A375E5W1_9BURK|nr:hypothetical protein CBM2614_B150151 [Cupriavidus taiwanensis]SOZ64384.1 hypothetical protein CBM2615_B140209 [Cupriavidus taiwanensis]SOZ68123.1 hypothetical protein CBM2613_B110209 [Cupriavidus taiwanensis]SPA07935.1 hypothetical protein CBM2625_B110210 [Cupriavidus taiwanensis]
MTLSLFAKTVILEKINYAFNSRL